MKWTERLSGALAHKALATCVALACLPAAAQTLNPTLDVDTMIDAALASLKAQRSARREGPAMDAALIALQRQMQSGIAAGARASRSGYVPAGVTMQGPQVRDGRVLVDAFVRGNPDLAASQLAAVGAQRMSRHGSLISAWVPVASLGNMGRATQIQSVRAAMSPVLNTGGVTSQGDSAQRSDLTRLLFGVDGAGTQVGILSDTWNARGGAAAGVAAGELPGPGNPNGYTTQVQILKDSPEGTDEGRGMGEIVHDVAPGAALSFYGPLNYLDHADGVRALARAGASVIVDDITWPNEPWFQANPIGAAAAQVGRDHGTVVFTSAGNRGRDAIEAAFNPGPAKPLLFNGESVGNWKPHRFANGQVTVPITLQPGNLINFILQWDEPHASASPPGVGAQSDLDVFIFGDSQGVNIIGAGVGNSIGNDPVDAIFGLTFNDPDPNARVTVYLGIGARDDLPGQARNFKIVAFDRGRVSTDIGRGTAFNSSTVLGHANEASFITSCAVRYDQVNGGALAVPEGSSSAGGFKQTINADGSRHAPLDTVKPDVCSPDGGNTSFFGGVDYEGDGLPNFFGTSASAPHAAAVAALMQQAAGGRSRLSPARIKEIMLGSTWEMDDPGTPGFQFGYDTKTGRGFLDPIRAVQAALFAAWQ